MTDEYLLPNPKDQRDWFKCLILSYKTLKGVDYANRSWDKIHWSRTAKSAKALLEICGTVRAADACMVEVSAKFDDRDLAWTLETIVKHAHDWIAKKRGPNSVNANPYRSRLFKDFTERGRSGSGDEPSQGQRSLFDSSGDQPSTREGPVEDNPKPGTTEHAKDLD